MPASADKSNAFYKDSARANLPFTTIDKIFPILHRGPIQLCLVVVFLVGLGALIIIAGIRFHKSTMMTRETNSLIQENIHHTDLLHHQVMDVLTPLFKIIGDEVGIRLPQRLAEIKQYILTKTNFFNPNRDFDFRELHWCIDPPDRVKVNFSKFCQAIHIDEGLRLIGDTFLNHSMFNSKLDFFPPTRCPNGVTTLGELVSPALSLTSLHVKHRGTISDILFAVSDGVYAKTYTLSSIRGDATWAKGSVRVFEIGLVRSWLMDLPVLHMTNFIHMDAESIGRYCTLAVGEMRLASVCSDERIIKVDGNPKGQAVHVSAVSMAVYGSDYFQQNVEIVPLHDDAVRLIHLSSHRGFIKNSTAYWAVPAEANITFADWPDCLTKICSSRSLPFCNLTNWEPFNNSLPAVYAILILHINIHEDLRLSLGKSHGPIILNGYGMDLYSNGHTNQYWLTIPPKSGSVLGIINRLLVNESITVMPYLLSFPISTGGDPCYAPVQPPLPSDTNILVESNIIVLSTGKFRYVSATYDTSRSNHAIVYYVYNPDGGSAYIFPFRIPTKGIPQFLRIECFVWAQKLWCIHAYQYRAADGDLGQVVENMVKLEFKCTVV
ncbi:hemagglutinin [Phyllostomus bat morbillivirus]|uniref:Hemagglutinin glycoprotein n=1 Tax=Phyllostomus bat morbillivirus TaxID=2853285 RepID=A0AAE9HS13_9MONO|nr:hemagglutinin [Phyllostomus bat morbillivirus]